MKRPSATDFAARDVRFHPADPAMATTLTTEQVDRYNHDGWIGPVDVLDAEATSELRTYVDWLIASVVGAEDRRNSYSINGYHIACAALWDLVGHPNVLGPVADVLGTSELVCWGTHLFAKLPGDGKVVPWHQDAVYWPFTPTRTTTVWLAVDDVGADNAPLQFVPGSHRDGPRAHEEVALDGSTVLARRAVDVVGDGPPVEDRLRAGQASLHNDLLLHGSAANRSDRRRAGLTLRYAAASVRLLDGFDDWRATSVPVLDGDPSGFWAAVPRPDGDHPERMAGHWGDFDGQPIDTSSSEEDP
jgi:hypothetical protein